MNSHRSQELAQVSADKTQLAEKGRNLETERDALQNELKACKAEIKKLEKEHRTALEECLPIRDHMYDPPLPLRDSRRSVSPRPTPARIYRSN
jgi:septal ring factor EnvC (AmiA/AmiB activator)